MKDALKALVVLVEHGAIAAVETLCRTAEKLMDFVDRWIGRRDRAEKEKKVKQALKEVEKTCHNGQLDDLIGAAEKLGDAKSCAKALAALLLAALAGCATVQVDINSARPWEGRYSSRSEAEAALRKVDFKKDKSVWMLTPDTLNRIITSAQEK